MTIQMVALDRSNFILKHQDVYLDPRSSQARIVGMRNINDFIESLLEHKNTVKIEIRKV